MNRTYLILCMALSSCAISSPPAGVAAPAIKPAASIVIARNAADWNNMEDVEKSMAGKPVRISGSTLDLRGCQLVGTKLKRYPAIQDERNQALRINIDGFTLKNGSTRDIPGGILFRGDGLTFSKLTFLGGKSEDSLSNVVDEAPNATVTGCKAYGATDKSFQFNDARGLTFSNNFATGGITGVRVQKKSTKYKGIRTKKVEGNSFDSMETAWNLSGGVHVQADGNHYKNVKLRWEENNGATHSEK